MHFKRSVAAFDSPPPPPPPLRLGLSLITDTNTNTAEAQHKDLTTNHQKQMVCYFKKHSPWAVGCCIRP